MNSKKVVEQLKPFKLLPAKGEMALVQNMNGLWQRVRVLDVYQPVDSKSTMVEVRTYSTIQNIHSIF